VATMATTAGVIPSWVSSTRQRAYREAQNNYNAHLTKASSELQSLLPDDCRREGMSQLATLVLLSRYRRVKV
jgi:hypothetical protein